MGNRGNVVVIGGGLAGISAAIALAESGLEVSLLEARPWLGGATCSFARRGLTIDNGQHLFLRCCTAYRDLLAKLGVSGSCSIQDRLDLTVLGPQAQARVRRSALPAPLHLARSLAGYRLLSPAERMRVAAAAAGLQLTEFGDRGTGQPATLGTWLGSRHQDKRARHLLWDLLSASSLSLTADRADAGLAADAIKTALLAHRDGADIGLPLVPLSKLHGAPAAGLLTRLGATIRLGVSATRVRCRPGGGFDISLGYAGPDDSEVAPRPAEIGAAGVVLAVPAWEAAAIAPAEVSEAAPWARLVPSPMISIHVSYDRRVTGLPFAAVVGDSVHWVVDKTDAAGLHAGQYLAVSVPAADSYVDMPAAQLQQLFLPRLARWFPAAASAEVTDFFVTRERRAMIRQTPGCERLRPAQEAPLRGLALAGAWTDTGWPDTMEGAVRSGHGAARKLVADLGAVVATGPAAQVPAPEPRTPAGSAFGR